MSQRHQPVAFDAADALTRRDRSGPGLLASASLGLVTLRGNARYVPVGTLDVAVGGVRWQEPHLGVDAGTCVDCDGRRVGDVVSGNAVRGGDRRVVAVAVGHDHAFAGRDERDESRFPRMVCQVPCRGETAGLGGEVRPSCRR